jgi:uncharacterized protein
LVSPGAKQDQLSRAEDGRLRVRIAARATEGKANTRLVQLLAKTLGVPSSNVTIARGAGSRQKVLEIEGLTSEEVDERIGEVLRF